VCDLGYEGHQHGKDTCLERPLDVRWQRGARKAKGFIVKVSLLNLRSSCVPPASSTTSSSTLMIKASRYGSAAVERTKP
jgi:hypothetical protein